MAFSVKQLLFVMFVAAVGLAALANADLPLVAELVDLFTLVTVIVLGYGAWVTTGERRAFRIGFVSWGVLYFIATKWWEISFNLATGKLLWLLHQPLQPNRLNRGTGEPFMNAQANWMSRMDAIGHCLFALLFGLIGGWVTVYFYRKRQRLRAKGSQ